MSAALDTLRARLAERLHLDRRDLDFGEHRIWAGLSKICSDGAERAMETAKSGSDQGLSLALEFLQSLDDELVAALAADDDRSGVRLAWPQRHARHGGNAQDDGPYAFRHVRVRIVFAPPSPARDRRKRGWPSPDTRGITWQEDRWEWRVPFVMSDREKPTDEIRKKQARRLSRAWRDSGAPQPGPSGETWQRHLSGYLRYGPKDRFVYPRLEGHLEDALSRFLGRFFTTASFKGDDIGPGAAAREAKAILAPLFRALGRVEQTRLELLCQPRKQTRSDLCVTMDRIPQEMWKKILRQSAQIDDWRRVLKLALPAGEAPPPALVEKHPTLPLDTSLLDRALSEKVKRLAEPLADRTDGLLVHADNFDGLGFLRKRFQGRVRLAYIDPPFNTATAQFAYRDAFDPGTWLTFMRDRLERALPLLAPDGTLYVHVDVNANHLTRCLLDEMLGPENLINEVIWRIGWVSGFKTAARRFVRNHDTIFIYGAGPRPYFDKDKARIPYVAHAPSSIREPLKAIRRAWDLSEDDMPRLKLVFKDEQGHVTKTGLKAKQGRYNVEDTWNCHEYEDLHSNKIKRNRAEYTPTGSALTQKPEQLLQRVIEVSSAPGDWVLDFFAGSGTTAAASFKLGRRFLAVEKGPHFDTDLVHRMKQVLFGRVVGISRKVGHRGGGAFEIVRLQTHAQALAALETGRLRPEDRAANLGRSQPST